MAGDQPVEQMAQRCELLLDALGLVGLGLELDPGRDMQRLDVEEVLDPGLGLGPQECRVCARDTRRVDPSPPGLAQGDNLVCPGSPRSGSALRHKQRPQAALGLRTNPARMA